jgi:hypothetical protein
MKRAGILGLAIVLTLGLAVSASQAAKAKKVKTEAELEGVRSTGPGESEFFGDVHSRKTRCEKRREVKLVYTGTEPIDDPVMGADSTDATGDWEVDTGGMAVYSGPYVVEVERKRFGRGDRRLKCKATLSPEQSLEDF